MCKFCIINDISRLFRAYSPPSATKPPISNSQLPILSLISFPIQILLFFILNIHTLTLPFALQALTNPTFSNFLHHLFTIKLFLYLFLFKLLHIPFCPISFIIQLSSISYSILFSAISYPFHYLTFQ